MQSQAARNRARMPHLQVLLLLLSQPVLQRMQLLHYCLLPCPVGSLKWPHMSALTAFTSLRGAYTGCWLAAPAAERSRGGDEAIQVFWNIQRLSVYSISTAGMADTDLSRSCLTALSIRSSY